MPQIDELSKDELLGLLYHLLPDTLTSKHPCYCAACGKDFTGETVTVKYPDKDRTVEAYGYICDRCNESFEQEKD